MKKSCPVCKENLQGRADKVYCSDYCRSSFHNSQNAEHKKAIRKVDSCLKGNRRILIKLLKENKIRFQKLYLHCQGFNFDFYTHELISDEGRRIKFCYDIGYIESKGKIEIIIAASKPAH